MKTKKKKNNNKNVQELKKNILAVFRQNPYQPYNYKQISHILGIGKSERDFVLRTLEQLVQERKVISSGRGKYQLNLEAFEDELSTVVEGIIEITSSGKGYVLQDDGMDILIKPPFLNKALHGDKVRVKLLPRRKNKKPEGKVIEVIERHRKQYVGTIKNKTKKLAFLIPDDQNIHLDFLVLEEHLHGAKHGDKVIAKIIDWPDHALQPFAEVVHVLGQPGNNEVEIQSILANYDFPLTFPEEVLKEVEQISDKIPSQEIKKKKRFSWHSDFYH